MLIIYGTKKVKFVKGESTKYFRCRHCGVDSQWQLTNVWTWFTLFFIPLFPVWKSKMLLCPNCSWGIKITQKNQELLNDVVLKSAKKKNIPASSEPAQISSVYAAEIENK